MSMLTVPQESWEWHCLKQSPGILEISGIACIFIFFKNQVYTTVCMDLELPTCFSAYFQPSFFNQVYKSECMDFVAYIRWNFPFQNCWMNSYSAICGQKNCSLYPLTLLQPYSHLVLIVLTHIKTRATF